MVAALSNLTPNAVRCWSCLLWFVALANTGVGHDLFTEYVQHRVTLTVGARHIDVTVQLTFFEDGSAHERAHMDTDADGRVSRAEIERYLTDIEGTSASALRLRIDGKPIVPNPLYPPTLDLLGNDRVGRGHHRLTLHFFARTPDDFPPGTELVVEDRLWPGLRALGALQVEGLDGARLEAHLTEDPVYPPSRDGTAREFRARLLLPPSNPVTEPTDPIPDHSAALDAL
jgi:hypothetical protein